MRAVSFNYARTERTFFDDELKGHFDRLEGEAFAAFEIEAKLKAENETHPADVPAATAAAAALGGAPLAPRAARGHDRRHRGPAVSRTAGGAAGRGHAWPGRQLLQRSRGAPRARRRRTERHRRAAILPAVGLRESVHTAPLAPLDSGRQQQELGG